VVNAVKSKVVLEWMGKLKSATVHACHGQIPSAFRPSVSGSPAIRPVEMPAVVMHKKVAAIED
jgi:hypothetical protein